MRHRIALLLPLALVVAACGSDDEPAATSSTTTSSSTTSTTSTTVAPAEPALVLASPEGVQLQAPDGTATVLSEAPAAAAYGAGDHVAFQDAEAAADVFPPQPDGPVRVWSDGEVRDVPADPGAVQVRLLDAGTVDGAPVALVAERIGGTSPTETFEELVQVDLRDLSRQTLVRRPGWESGHDSAQLLPDGDVVGVIYSEAQLSLARWTAGEEEPVWTTPLGVDVPPAELVRGSGVHVVDRPRPDGSPLRVRTFDAGSGAPAGEAEVALGDLADGGALECRAWLAAERLGCARSGAGPVAIDLDGGHEQLGGPLAAIPVPVR